MTDKLTGGYIDYRGLGLEYVIDYVLFVRNPSAVRVTSIFANCFLRNCAFL